MVNSTEHEIYHAKIYEHEKNTISDSLKARTVFHFQHFSFLGAV